MSRPSKQYRRHRFPPQIISRRCPPARASTAPPRAQSPVATRGYLRFGAKTCFEFPTFTPEGHAVSSPNGVREITNRARKALEPSTYGFEGRCQGIWTIAYDPPRKFRLGFRRSVRSPKAVVGRTGSA